MSRVKSHVIIKLAGLVIALCAVCLIRLLIDREPGGVLRLAWPEASYAVFRITSIILAVSIGGSLAVSGVLLQALLRNPLASPFILGISSGGGLGVMVGMYVSSIAVISISDEFVHAGSALIGALVILGVVFLLGRRRGVLDPLSLVLVGVVLSAMCSACMMILELMGSQLRSDFLFWMMGHIRQGASSTTIFLVGGMCLVGTLLSALMGRRMDAATLGDDEARSVGLDLGPLRVGMFLLAGALAAMTVAVAGPIGFVGLVAPHAARIVVGPQHRVLVIASALTGAILLVAADSASQALDFGVGRVPVGVFTALIGGPAFIWLLRTGKGQV